MDHNVKLGFSTGVLYKDMETKEAISVIKGLGCTVIELAFLRIEKFSSDQLERIVPADLEGFEYVSFHAPKFDYKNDRETKDILEKISWFNKAVRRLDCVVFHPDTVGDFSIFNDVDFNVSFENMDHRKESYRSVNDMGSLLSTNKKYGFVLDMNHIYVNDPTMALANEFYKTLGDRIKEVHLSGFKVLHDPLFETEQSEIIKAIQNFDVPIIVESLLTPGTIVQEKDYILKNI